jgi:multidrug efflux system outer membrane protein
MKLGPDYRRPDTGIEVPASYQYGPSETETLQLEDQWWHVFGDPELNQLVEEVLANNLDIRKSTAAVLEVRAQIVQTRADRFPSLSLQAKGERQRRPEGGSVSGQAFSLDREIDTPLTEKLTRTTCRSPLPSRLTCGVVLLELRKRLGPVSCEWRRIAAQ